MQPLTSELEFNDPPAIKYARILCFSTASDLSVKRLMVLFLFLIDNVHSIA